jgi:hypothetical protein
MIILGTNSVKGGFNVDNSLRFNDGSSDYLSITPGSAGNRRTFTFSTWVKRGVLGDKIIFAAGADSNVDGYVAMYFSGEALRVRLYESSAKDVVTSMLFKDLSAWYNIIVAVDTTQGTAANRVKIYVNGLEATKASGSYVSEDFDTSVNNAVIQQVGVGRDSSGSLSNYFDGYLAETVLIDGLALDATSFGEFDEDSGIWKPKNVSGLTFGTNGFYLQFKEAGTSQNSSGMGADTSGNTNHFAVNNLTAVDQSTDTCTNNFATMNPLNVPASNAPTFAEGNLKTTCAVTGGAYMGSSTIGVSSGKWYVEMKVKTIDSILAGVSANASEDARDSSYPGAQNDSASILLNSGNKYIANSGSTHGDAFSADDVLMIALDLDNNNVYFGRNGNWFDGSGNADESSPNSAISLTAAASTTDGFYFFSVGDGGGSAAAAAEWNFGSPMYAISSGNTDGNGYGNFEYAVPSGYYSLNTKNLAEFG